MWEDVEEIGQTIRKDNGCDNTLAIYLNYVSMAPLIARKQYGVQRMDIGQQVWSFQSCSVFGPAREGKELQLKVGPRQQPAVDGCCGSRSWPWALDNSQLLVAVVGTVADHHNILTHQQSLLLFACSKMRLTLNSHFFYLSFAIFKKVMNSVHTMYTN